LPLWLSISLLFLTLLCYAIHKSFYFLTNILFQAQHQVENAYPGQSPSAPSLPYPIHPNTGIYPSLSEYMGLELSPAVLAANMPEYVASVRKNIF